MAAWKGEQKRNNSALERQLAGLPSTHNLISEWDQNARPAAYSVKELL